jgi:hypothetical protein
MADLNRPTHLKRPTTGRRSRPMLIAPLIPLLGIVGIFGIDQFHGTRFLSAFVTVWCVLLAGLFSYVLVRVLDARRARR